MTMVSKLLGLVGISMMLCVVGCAGEAVEEGTTGSEDSEQAPEVSVEQSNVDPQQRPAAVCVYTCRTSHGIEVCKGNGPQCNGVDP